MVDDLRSVNGLTSQVGRYDGIRPPREVDMDPDGGDSPGPDYHPNEWKEPEQPATTRIRRRRASDSDSGDERPSPLQQELDRLRSVGETKPVDTKSLRGRRYYSGESSAYHRAVDVTAPPTGQAAESLPSQGPEAEHPTVATTRVPLPEEHQAEHESGDYFPAPQAQLPTQQPPLE